MVVMLVLNKFNADRKVFDLFFYVTKQVRNLTVQASGDI